MLTSISTQSRRCCSYKTHPSTPGASTMAGDLAPAARPPDQIHLNLNTAVWMVPSMNLNVSSRHVFAHDSCVVHA